MSIPKWQKENLNCSVEREEKAKLHKQIEKLQAKLALCASENSKVILELQKKNDRLKERLQVELRASNVLAHEKYPKTDYFTGKGGEK